MRGHNGGRFDFDASRSAWLRQLRDNEPLGRLLMDVPDAQSRGDRLIWLLGLREDAFSSDVVTLAFAASFDLQARIGPDRNPAARFTSDLDVALLRRRLVAAYGDPWRLGFLEVQNCAFYAAMAWHDRRGTRRSYDHCDALALPELGAALTEQLMGVSSPIASEAPRVVVYAGGRDKGHAVWSAVANVLPAFDVDALRSQAAGNESAWPFATHRPRSVSWAVRDGRATVYVSLSHALAALAGLEPHVSAVRREWISALSGVGIPELGIDAPLLREPYLTSIVPGTGTVQDDTALLWEAVRLVSGFDIRDGMETSADGTAAMYAVARGLSLHHFAPALRDAPDRTTTLGLRDTHTHVVPEHLTWDLARDTDAAGGSADAQARMADYASAAGDDLPARIEAFRDAGQRLVARHLQRHLDGTARLDQPLVPERQPLRVQVATAPRRVTAALAEWSPEWFGKPDSSSQGSGR